MSKRIINYSIIRFLPYSDEGEFVNVGILGYSVDSKVLGFIVEPRSMSCLEKRVNSFFSDLDKDLFPKLIGGLKEELDGVLTTHEGSRSLFDEMIAPRESLFEYGPACTRIMAGRSFDNELQEIYDYYITRHFG